MSKSKTPPCWVTGGWEFHYFVLMHLSLPQGFLHHARYCILKVTYYFLNIPLKGQTTISIHTSFFINYHFTTWRFLCKTCCRRIMKKPCGGCLNKFPYPNEAVLACIFMLYGKLSFYPSISVYISLSNALLYSDHCILNIDDNFKQSVEFITPSLTPSPFTPMNSKIRF